MQPKLKTLKKTLYLLIIYLITFSSFAQTDSVKTKTLFYSAIGVSIGNVNSNDESINNFNKASYPSLEVGIIRKNVSLGAVFGYENMLVSSSTRKFYEIKTAISHPIGDYSGYILFGVGSYFEKNFNNFIEYGVGFSYAPKKLGYSVQYSNWATVNFVSVGLSYTFNN